MQDNNIPEQTPQEPYASRPEHKTQVEHLISLLPRKLDLDTIGMVDELWRLERHIIDLAKQSFLVVVDRWLRKEFVEGMRLEIEYLEKEGFYVSRVLSAEDKKEAESIGHAMAEELNNINIGRDTFPYKIAQSLNSVGWDKLASRNVLASYATGMIDGDGMAWLDSFPATIQQRQMELDTDQVRTKPAKPGRL